MEIENLLPENILEIVQNLNYVDIANLCKTNQRFSNLCKLPQIQKIIKELKVRELEARNLRRKIKFKVQEILRRIYFKGLRLYNFLNDEEQVQWKTFARSHIRDFFARHPEVDRVALYTIISNPPKERAKQNLKVLYEYMTNPFLDEVDYLFLMDNPYILESDKINRVSPIPERWAYRRETYAEPIPIIKPEAYRRSVTRRPLRY